MKKLVIRDLVIDPPVALAPMVGLSHSAFRSLVHEEGGVGLYFSEMLAAKRLPHDNENVSPLLARSSCEYPLVYQLVAAGMEYIEPAVEKLHVLNAQGIDLNLGCSAPLVKKQGGGASLAENDPQLIAILRVIRRSTKLPVSVKIRLGRELNVKKLVDKCRLFEDEGVDFITIHARLDGEKFCRKPRWQAISAVKKAISVPIFANGGIYTVEDAKACLEESGADGLMIGRGAVEKPWLCSEIARDVFGSVIPETKRSTKEIFFRFFDLLEDRFARERQLGRLKQFTRYFASSFAFGHSLASSVQNADSMINARDEATLFFAQLEDSSNC